MLDEDYWGRQLSERFGGWRHLLLLLSLCCWLLLRVFQQQHYCMVMEGVRGAGGCRRPALLLQYSYRVYSVTASCSRLCLLRFLKLENDAVGGLCVCIIVH